MRISETHSARLLAVTEAPATGWPVETYAVHETEEYCAIQQVQIFHAEGRWHAWPGNLWRPSARTLGHLVAEARNGI